VNDDTAESTTSARGKWLGLVLVLVLGASILVTAFRASERYYGKNLVLTDTSYFLMSVGLLLQGRGDFDTGHVLATPAPLLSSDHATEVYVLHNLTAWLLRAVLPVRPSAAVVLNAPWFLAMGLSVYWLVWDRTKAWRVSALVAAGYLVANPYLTTVRFGLTSLDPNLHAFMIGTSALAWVMLSRSFRDLRASIVAGAFLGLLVLARAYTLGIVAPAMLPFVVGSLWTKSRSDLRASLVGGALALLSMLVVCGWWLFPHLDVLRFYPTQFKSAGVLGRTDLTTTLLAWWELLGQFLSGNMPTMCVLTWVLADELLHGERRPARAAQWSHLWLAVSPLLILSYLGVRFGPYGTLALFGIYMTLLFPFGWPGRPILRRGLFAAVLAGATAINTLGACSSLVEAHAGVPYDRRPVDKAIEAIRKDAERAHRPRVTVGLVHWGILHDASLIDALMFDAGLRVATPTYPVEPRSGSPLVVDPMALDCWVWDRRVRGDQAMTPELWASKITERADYVIVLAADALQRRRGGRWPPWVKASRLLLDSPAFMTIAGPLDVGEDGPIQVLARRHEPGPPHRE
jgi:hypothetical protein